MTVRFHRCFLAMMVVVGGMRGAPVVAQETPGKEDAQVQQAAEGGALLTDETRKLLESDPEFAAEFGRRRSVYQEEKAKLADAMLAQRSAYLRYQNTEEKTSAARIEYRKARRAVELAMMSTYRASLSWLQMGGSEEVVQYIITMVQNLERADIYNLETLNGAAICLDGGRKELYFFLAAGRSAACLGDTDLAKRVFESVDLEMLTDPDKALLASLEPVKEQYDAEIKRYEQDTENDDLPRVQFETTAGDFVVELFLKDAPSTVSNFIDLVEQGFYDGLDFVQVVDHLLALTGDPSSNGTGNSGNFLKDEGQGDDPPRYALRGSLVMAKIPLDKGEFLPNSGSSQFAILYLPAPAVTRNQTVFGRVIEGMDVVSRLRRVDPSEKKSKDKIEVPPDQILTATVIRRPESLPKPDYVLQSKPRFSADASSSADQSGAAGKHMHDHGDGHDHSHGSDHSHQSDDADAPAVDAAGAGTE